MASPQHKKPFSLWIMKFTILIGRPFLCHHYYICNLSETCLGVEKKIFKEIHQFYPFTPKLPPLGVGSHDMSPYHTAFS